MLFATVEIDDAFLETSLAKWHDGTSCIASIYIVNGVKTSDAFSFTECGGDLIDYYWTLGN